MFVITDTLGKLDDVSFDTLAAAQKARTRMNRELNAHGRFWVRTKS